MISSLRRSMTGDSSAVIALVSNSQVYDCSGDSDTGTDYDEVVHMSDDDIDNVDITGDHYSDTDSENSEQATTSKLLQQQRSIEQLQEIRDRFSEVVDIANSPNKGKVKPNRSILDPPSIEQENVHLLASSPIRIERYFGERARSDFLGKINVAYQEEAIKGDSGIEGAYSKPTAFLPSKEEFVDMPFAPRRPQKKTAAMSSANFVESLGDVSCLGGYDDRPGLYVDAPSTVCSLDHAKITDYEHDQPSSPRTTFIAGCIKQKLNPRASLVLRKNVSKSLNLQHQGMGDTMGVVFAQSLKNMPFLESINISDNHLTDISLSPIIEALSCIPGLTHLNLSKNVVNSQAAKALASLVAKKSTLRQLVLSEADLSDYECQMFVVAASENASLMHMDLSGNDIGKCYLSHALNNQDGNGPQGLACLIASNYCCLESLNLRWNHISMEGAVLIAQSLRMNGTLMHLDLSFNSLGNTAGEIVGSSILSNNVIKTLNLDNNNIRGSGCFTICVGIMENNSLERVCMNSNPFSELGAAILMKLPLAVGHRVKISANNCNFHKANYKSRNEKFDHDNPAGSYELHLEKPFERAIAFRLLHLVATSPQYTFTKFQYRKPLKKKKGINTWRNIVLVESISKEKLHHMTDFDLDHMQNLCQLRDAARDLKKARKLFEKYDIDGSNSLDKHEMLKLLIDIGIPADHSVVNEAFKAYDADGAGTIELDEFCLYLTGQVEEANRLLSDMTESKILVQKHSSDLKYRPPACGTLMITVEWNFANVKSRQVISRSALHDCAEMIKEGNIGAKVKLMSYAIEDVFLRKNEALFLYRLLKEEFSDPIEVLPKILSRMLTTEEADELFALCLPNEDDRRRFRSILGCCLNPMLGIFNGYYELNLGFQKDRDCLKQLLAMNEVNKSCAISSSLFRPGVTGDLSQTGDWSSFRNVIYKSKTFHISLQKFHPMPHSGVLTFDFCGALKPPMKAKSLSDRRFINMLKNIGILQESNEYQARIKYNEMKSRIASAIRGDGSFDNGISKETSKRILYFRLKFYGTLVDRIVQVRTVKEIECIQISQFKADAAFSSTPTNTDIGNQDVAGEDGSCDDSSLSSDDCVSHKAYLITTDADTLDFFSESTKKINSFCSPHSAIRKSSKKVSSASAKRTSRLKILKRKSAKVNKVSSGYGKAALLTHEVVHVFRLFWLKCAHIAMILHHFRLGKLKKTDNFGSYRVEIICQLFHRIVDVHNFDIVLSELGSQEIACVYCRIGMLHLFNPMKPEGWHFLDLSKREERSVSKMLTYLSIEEPCKNWFDATFQWKYDGEIVPGWQLPSRWGLDKHFPHHGFLCLKYVTVHEEKEEGHGNYCSALVPLRKSLFHLVYIDEEDVVNDGANIDASGERIHKRVVKLDNFGKKGSFVSSGQILSKGQHAVQWNNLLAPLNSTSVKIAGGVTVEAIFDREKTRRNSEIDYLNNIIGEFDMVEPSTASSTSRVISSKTRVSAPRPKPRMDMSIPGATGRRISSASNSPAQFTRKRLNSLGSSGPRPATAMSSRRSSTAKDIKK